MSARRAAPLLLLLFALAGCGGGGEASAPATTAAGGGVENLDNVLQLRAAFEADQGKTRLLVLFSPT
jgi:ABC-type glycerol-3-phosphate transport system substrate-binding protein